MAVSERDVRHIAELARLGLEPDRVPLLAGELNTILSHMDELRAVDTSSVDGAVPFSAPHAPLRPDVARTLPALDPSTFGPRMSDGFFLVPRLGSHEQE